MISKYRNYSLYKYHSISRFFAWTDFISFGSRGSGWKGNEIQKNSNIRRDWTQKSGSCAPLQSRPLCFILTS